MPNNQENDFLKEDLSEKFDNNNKEITCKDGFCFLPNRDDKTTINNENINIFDPV